MSFKPGRVIEDNEWIIWWKFKKKLIYFFELLQIFGIENL